MPLAYILLSYGKRHGIRLADHPAAQAQGRHIRRSLPEDAKIAWLSDYARSVGSLDDLPGLKKALQAIRNSEGKNILVIADLTILFRNASISARNELRRDLEELGDHILDASRRSFFSKMPLDLRKVIQLDGAAKLTARNTVRSARRSSGPIQTASASAASRDVRSDMADQKADVVQALLAEMTTDAEGPPSLTALAAEANRRGLLTTRNGKWTSSTIGRTLRRLESAP